MHKFRQCDIERGMSLEKFSKTLKEISLLDGIQALLDWDQQVFMPQEGSKTRAGQLEFIATLRHEKLTSEDFFSVVSSLYDNQDVLNEWSRVNVRETFRTVSRERKLPSEFVAEKSRLSSETYVAWVSARPHNDFKSLVPNLSRLVELARKESELVGFEGNPYDALLDVYEPGSTFKETGPLLTELGDELSKLIPKIRAKLPPDLEPLFPLSISHQERLSNRIASDLGYDFSKGRLDATAHPFCTTIGIKDVRITSRFFEESPLSGLFSTIHETGHALYELNLPSEHFGTPMGSAVSLGVHESQSRFYENILGRSRPFASYLSRMFRDECQYEVDKDILWQHLNNVRPSSIRVEADEVTYSLHIVIRMVLEEKLISGELKVPDLPEAWNELYKKYLGILPENLKDGVLQDVHWYSGGIGYFPTYALGNIYSGALYFAMMKDIHFDSLVEKGEFSPILAWLKEKVYSEGMCYKPKHLIEKASRVKLSTRFFLDYITSKFSIE